MGALAAQAGAESSADQPDESAAAAVDYDRMTPQEVLDHMNKLFAEKKFAECSVAVDKILSNKEAKDLHPKAYACLSLFFIFLECMLFNFFQS